MCATLAHMGERWCNRCRTTKNLLDFPLSVNQREGRSYTCKPCCSNKIKETNRKKRRELMELLCRGIPTCVFCGYNTNILALVFDHKDNDPDSDTPEGRATGATLLRVIRESPHRFQVLCQNCNAIKQYSNTEGMHANRTDWRLVNRNMKFSSSPEATHISIWKNGIKPPRREPPVESPGVTVKEWLEQHGEPSPS